MPDKTLSISMACMKRGDFRTPTGNRQLSPSNSFFTLPANRPGITQIVPDLRLAPPTNPAYSSRFNDPCIEIDLRPRSPASAGNRGAFRRRYHRPARPFRGICRAQPAGRQEAHLAARPDPDQPVLRGLDPHPVLVRAGGQTARRRRHEHVGDLVLDPQGRDADGHRGDAERHAPGYPGRPSPRLRRGGTAGAQGRRFRHQRRRRCPRASDASAARRADHPPQQRPARRAGRCDLRRRHAFARRPLQHPPAQHHGRAGARGRALHAACRAASSGWASKSPATCAKASKAPTS